MNVNEFMDHAPEDSDREWAQRKPEPEVMDNAAENVAYDRIATRWLGKVIYPALIKELNPESTKHILDVCSGSGRLTLALMQMLPRATICGADLSPSMLDLARTNTEFVGVTGHVEFRLEDVAATSFDDDQFDAAISYGSLHHWQNPQAVFAELARVVRPGGQIIIGDWRRDPVLLNFFNSLRGTLEWSLIEASARASYRVDEVTAMLEPLASVCEWQVAQHAMGLLIRGHVLTTSKCLNINQGSDVHCPMPHSPSQVAQSIGGIKC